MIDKRKCKWHLEGFCCKYAPYIKEAQKIWQCLSVSNYCKEYEEGNRGII